VRIVILEDAAAVALAAANESIDILGLSTSLPPIDRHKTVVGLATGGTPLGLYKQWIERRRRGEISFSHVTSFNLDEYIGLPRNHPRSYHTYMQQHLFAHIDIDPIAAHVPETDVASLEESAAQYECLIDAAGGIDLQILGIGTEGHIGFNEIGSSFSSRTRVKTLTEKTRRDNARYFERLEDVPSMALTMGLGTIMDSKAVLLLATGASKAHAIRAAVEGPVTAMMPASILQFHENVTFLLDDAAASGLQHQDYYRQSESNRRKIPPI
jgi:glucosamine-6-phosphate deaminase